MPNYDIETDDKIHHVSHCITNIVDVMCSDYSAATVCKKRVGNKILSFLLDNPKISTFTYTIIHYKQRLGLDTTVVIHSVDDPSCQCIFCRYDPDEIPNVIGMLHELPDVPNLIRL